MLYVNQSKINQKYSTKSQIEEMDTTWDLAIICKIISNYFVFFVPEAFVLHDGLILFAKPL